MESDFLKNDVTPRILLPEMVEEPRVTKIGLFRRDEDGSLIIFSLFIFVMILFVAGMAVDLMRFETDRTALQNSLDGASLAATNLDQERDPVDLVKDIMEKRGYDRDLVNVVPVESYSGDIASPDPGTLMSRRVTASYDLTVNTFFMPLLGIDTLGTNTAGEAFERVQNVEVSLVLDISGSMSGTKLSDLKESAKKFFREVINEEAEEGAVSVSLIPYNHTVVVPDIIFDQLTTNAAVPVLSPAAYTGALEFTPLNHPRSRCVRWRDSEMTVNASQLRSDVTVGGVTKKNYELLRAVTTSQVLDMMAYYDPGNKSAGDGGTYGWPAHESNRRCDPTRSPILPYQTTLQPLEDHVDAFYAAGNTAIDHGMKWGVALLDPAFRTVVDDLIDNHDFPEKLRDRPYDYDSANSLKVVVLMTDGRNTGQYDLKPDFKRGPSRFWYSEKAGSEQVRNPNYPTEPNEFIDVSGEYIVDINENGNPDREKDWYDGYYILMPDNGEETRFMRPHRPWDNTSDARLYSVAELPDDARQMDYSELYDRFSENALAEFFRDDQVGDWGARQAHREADYQPISGAEGDERLNGDDSLAGICAAAKVDAEILVYTIAFGSGADTTEMGKCSSGEGYAFTAADGEQLTAAFEAIASSITRLRLTQ